jgi:hypothetical protein
MANANVGNDLIKYVMNVITVVAAAAATLGDIIIFGPWVGIACNDAALGEELSLDIEEGKEYDCVSAVSGVGAAVGDDLFYNPTTGAFAAVPGAGYYNIGTITKVRDGNNCFRFEKRRRWISSAGEGTITLADISDLANLTVTMSQISNLASLTLADLADVNTAGVTNNDTLKYDTATSTWIVVAVAD